MAKSHGKNSVFWIDDAGGTLRNISAYLDSIDVPFSVDSAETSTMGDAAKEYIPGLADGTITIGGIWDNTATTGADAILGGVFDANGELTAGGALSWEYGPEGGSATNIKYSGDCYMTGYSVASDLTGAVKFTATFQITGAVTKGAFSA